MVPNVFSIEWEEYNQHYKNLIFKASEPVRKRILDEQIKAVKELEKDLIEKGFDIDKFWKDLEKKYGLINFNFLEDDGAYLIDDAFVYLDMIAENEFSDDRITAKHIEAYKYFEDVIGVKVTEIFSRWKKAPHLFVPIRATSKNIGPITELYTQALKCYVFGLNEAAISMCRSLLEHALKHHYHVEEWGLRDKIKSAKKKVIDLADVRLEKVKKDGDEVMHRYDQGKKHTELNVLLNLNVLRKVIDEIPKY